MTKKLFLVLLFVIVLMTGCGEKESSCNTISGINEIKMKTINVETIKVETVEVETIIH